MEGDYIKMSRKQKDLQYISKDGLYTEGFVIRVKNDEAREMMDTGKWKKLNDQGGLRV